MSGRREAEPLPSIEVYRRQTHGFPGVEFIPPFQRWAFTLYVVWTAAFLEGGRLTVTIDRYNEMWIEYVMWVVVTVVITIGFTDYLNRRENR